MSAKPIPIDFGEFMKELLPSIDASTGSLPPRNTGAVRDFTQSVGIDKHMKRDLPGYDVTGYSIGVNENGQLLATIKARGDDGTEIAVCIPMKTQCRKLGKWLQSVGASDDDDLCAGTLSDDAPLTTDRMTLM